MWSCHKDRRIRGIEMKIEIIDKVLVKSFNDFIRNISNNDKVGILHHTDPDGISSAVIMNKIVHESRNKSIDVQINQKPYELNITEKTLSVLKKNKVNKFIIVDLSVDQYSKKTLNKITKFAEILIIDHHKLYKNLNTDSIVHIKPQLFCKGILAGQYNTSKLVFDLGSGLFDLKRYDWLAALGIIGDQTNDTWKSFLKSVYKRNKLVFHNDVSKTRIGRVTDIVYLTEVYDVNKVSKCYHILNQAENYKDVLKSDLKEYQKKVVQEINYWKKNVIKYAEIFPNQEIVFDYIKPRYHIRSVICSILSNKYPDKTVIIAQDTKNDFIHLSVRRKDHKIAVNELLEKILKNFTGAAGGGHVHAAGGVIRKQDLYKFRDNVISMMDNRVIFRT